MRLFNKAGPRQGAGSRSGTALNIVTTVVLVLLVALLILELIPSNYYVLLPGDALPVAPMISIPGHPPVRKQGTLAMTDVNLVKIDHKLEELYFRLQSDASFEDPAAVSGGQSPQQFTKTNALLMSDSIEQAEAAALNTVPGYHISCKPPGPQIVAILKDTPAAKSLRPSDYVSAINGHRTTCSRDVQKVVSRLAPGGTIALTIVRKGRRLVYHIRTVPATNHVPDRHGKSALIGISMTERFAIPLNIKIQPGPIGGPSAGLMFALGVVQRLRHTDLAHGCHIAGTGTIDATGQVGPIGGAAQKIVAARDAGAQYFLVPTAPDNLNPARAHADGVTVLPVTSLRQALQTLQRIKPCK